MCVRGYVQTEFLWAHNLEKFCARGESVNPSLTPHPPHASHSVKGPPPASGGKNPQNTEEPHSTACDLELALEDIVTCDTSARTLKNKLGARVLVDM